MSVLIHRYLPALLTFVATSVLSLFGIESHPRLAGNLIFDDTHAYHYDAWNRLIQVNRAELESDPGIPPAPAEIELGLIVKRYTYDGLGRLIRTRSPWPDPDTSTGEQLEERFAYDGIRRIQEVAVKLASNGTTQSTTLAREYVWGPGDNGVDELLAQFGPSPTRAPTFILQDAGLDAIAVCDLGGTPSTPFPNGTARIVGQVGYDAYGSVVTAETLFAHAPLHVGHKGLLFDRLDLGVVDPTTLEEMPRLAVGSILIGHVRHRIYLPRLGRWAQRDPNATGAVLMASSMHGDAAVPDLAHFDLEANYFDGANSYEYLSAAPFTHSDTLGLFSTAWAAPLAPGIAARILTDALIRGVSLAATRSGLWALNWGTAGVLTATYNVDIVIMAVTEGSSRGDMWDNLFREIGSGGGPQYDPKHMTTKESVLARDWGIPLKHVQDAIHAMKRGGQVSGSKRNPDLIIIVELEMLSLSTPRSILATFVMNSGSNYGVRMAKATVSLLIGGPRLDPVWVASVLRRQPTRAHVAKDPKLRRMLGDRVWALGIWEVTEKDVDIDDIAATISRLAHLLPSDCASWPQLSDTKVMISVGLFDLSGLGDMWELDDVTLAAMAIRRIHLTVDGYGS